MESFVRITEFAAPLLQINIDTDQIIPSRFLPRTQTPNGLGEGLFYQWKHHPDGRLNPEFVLNRAPFDRAPILIAGRNFGCGSSREGAPKALRQCGFRAVVAPSFGDIFYGNCFRNGIVPVALPEPVVVELAEAAESRGADALLTIDLERDVLTDSQGREHPFSSPARLRRMLLEGLDEIGLTLQLSDAIEAYRSADRLKRPWAYGADGTCGMR